MNTININLKFTHEIVSGNLVDRVIRLSHKSLCKANIEIAKRLLRDNEYPESFIISFH